MKCTRRAPNLHIHKAKHKKAYNKKAQENIRKHKETEESIRKRKKAKNKEGATGAMKWTERAPGAMKWTRRAPNLHIHKTKHIIYNAYTMTSFIPCFNKSTCRI